MLTRYAYQYSLLPLINGPAPAPVEAEVEAEAAPDRSPSLRSPIRPGTSALPEAEAEVAVAVAAAVAAEPRRRNCRGSSTAHCARSNGYGLREARCRPCKQLGTVTGRPSVR